MKTDKHSKRYAQIAAETAIFHLNQQVTGLFIAEIVSKSMPLKNQELPDFNHAIHGVKIQDAPGQVTGRCLARYATTAAKLANSHLNQGKEKKFSVAGVLKIKKKAQ